jgi:peptidoglycan/LPS O-acetylase OafA/YrhL
MDLEAAHPRLPALTSLRFFAAFHVVIFHLQAMKIVQGPAWYEKLASVGYVGVSFFFVLSGFILVYTYAGRTLSLKDFWRARFARIYPAYAFSLLFTAPWFFIAVLKFDIPFFAWPKAHLKLAAGLVVTLLQAWVPPAALTWNPVAWSLSVEAFFYLLFPFLLLLLIRRSLPQLLLIAAAAWLASLTFSTTYVVLNPDHLTVVNAQVPSPRSTPRIPTGHGLRFSFSPFTPRKQISAAAGTFWHCWSWPGGLFRSLDSLSGSAHRATGAGIRRNRLWFRSEAALEHSDGEPPAGPLR